MRIALEEMKKVVGTDCSGYVLAILRNRYLTRDIVGKVQIYLGTAEDFRVYWTKEMDYTYRVDCFAYSEHSPTIVLDRHIHRNWSMPLYAHKALAEKAKEVLDDWACWDDERTARAEVIKANLA